MMFLDIARRHFRIETLEDRHLDALDFHEVSCSAIRKVMYEVYSEGFKAGQASERGSGASGETREAPPSPSPAFTDTGWKEVKQARDRYIYAIKCQSVVRGNPALEKRYQAMAKDALKQAGEAVVRAQLA